jgi:NodT family efflux transporter outer membrane factor (OMF) lipoprotein
MGMRSSSVALLAAFTALGGCAVGPNYHPPKADAPPVFVGATAASDAAAPDPAVWWQALNDAKLNSLVERAIIANPDIEIALLHLQQARSFEAVVIGHALPEADVSGAAAKGTGTDLARSRALQPLVSADNTSGLQHINEIGGFDAVWELDIFGKYRREFEAARADAQAAAAARSAVITSVIADVVRGYVDLRGLQVQVGVFAKAHDVLAESLRLVNIRYERGITNELDVALARRELASLSAQVEPLNAQMRAAQYTLASLLGEYPEQLSAELNAPDLVPATPAVVAVGLPVELLRRRPDVQEAERQVAAANARIGAATANLLPQVALIGSLGAQAQGLGLPDIGKHIWSFGPAAAWPLLDFGALDAQVEIAQLETKARLQAYRKIVINAVREVDTAIEEYRAQQDRLRELGEALMAAERAVTVATERYDRGLTDFLNVIDAERQFYDLQAQYATAQVIEGEQYVQLYKGLGGGWQNYQKVPPIHIPQPAIIAAFKRTLAPATP